MIKINKKIEIYI